MWQKAAEQVFFSLSVSWGPLITFGSYNTFNNKVHIDSMVISSLDFLTSIIASVAIFSIMGSLAESAGVKVREYFDVARTAVSDVTGSTLNTPAISVVAFIFIAPWFYTFWKKLHIRIYGRHK